jgi:formate-dependent nitrite reductase membrane component NrfD
MYFVSVFLVAIAIGALCAAVLYRSARARHRHAVLWAVAGFFFNVIALVVWIVAVGPIVTRES